VNAHPNNPSLYRKPTVMATIMLIDPQSGTPLSIMGGTHITAMRTGAAGGLATKYLAEPSSRTLGLIGTGAQSRTQLQAIHQAINLTEVRAYDVMGEALSKFVRETREQYEVKVTPCRSVDECLRTSDVICTLTPSTSPVVKKAWIHPGMHINAIGADAPGKQELDPMILKISKIIVDDLVQTLHCGEINVPVSQGILREEDIYAELGEIIIGAKPGRTHSEEITVFDSTGISLQDISTAHTVFKKAKTKKIGKWMAL
jgi:alanine dehydrogenase